MSAREILEKDNAALRRLIKALVKERERYANF